jgi:glycosyltransferase involved in cell wall biosynthesis
VKLGVVDLSFHWPPKGGSWVEVAEVCRRLPRWGIEAVLVVPRVRTDDMERGLLSSDPGFPVVRVPISSREFDRRKLPSLLAAALRRERVDRVWLTNAFNLAPCVMAAVREWPTVWKVFGYEVVCPNYMSLHPSASIAQWSRQNPRGEVCPRNFFTTPLFCTACAAHAMGPALVAGRRNSYSHEWLASGAYLPHYVTHARRAVRSCLGVMVYSALARQKLAAATQKVRIVPGGVDTSLFSPNDVLPEDLVLMAGRADDPRKGLSVFATAVALLRDLGWSGTAVATTTLEGEVAPGVHGTGWIPHHGMPELYRRAKVVVVPTLWPEPFGLVALEAMACGRPVVATDIGGLSGTVGETGLIFPPGDAEALSVLLYRLLHDTEMWRRSADAGRTVAETYAWDKVVEAHHLPLLAGGATWWAERPGPILV